MAVEEREYISAEFAEKSGNRKKLPG